MKTKTCVRIYIFFVFFMGWLFLSSCKSIYYNSVKIGNVDKVKRFLDAHPDMSIDHPNYQKNSALMIAVIKKKPAMVAALLKHGADVNYQRPDSHTSLRAAIFNLDVDMVRYLIDAGADVNLANKLGWTPLMTASRSGSLSIVQLLVEAGADIYATTNKGMTPRAATLPDSPFIYEYLTRLMEQDPNRPKMENIDLADTSVDTQQKEQKNNQDGEKNTFVFE